jgi:hypothetical protein
MAITETNAETDDGPAVDERDPATLIPAAVEEILRLAATWLAWDGAPILSDGTITLESDWARFTEGDLNEAANRLRRHAELYRLRLGALSAAELDLPRPAAWTVRQIAHHVAGVTYYAHQVGDLAGR